jgi:hypothetical protein
MEMLIDLLFIAFMVQQAEIIEAKCTPVQGTWVCTDTTPPIKIHPGQKGAKRLTK